jgi:hypothetical protein
MPKPAAIPLASIQAELARVIAGPELSGAKSLADFLSEKDEIQGLITDKGQVVSCVLTRITK